VTRVVEDRSLLAPEVVQDPHPYFHQLRASDPVHWSEIHRGWLLTRHDDVVAAFRDQRLSSSRVSSLLPYEPTEEEQAAFEPIWRSLANWMVFKDPPEHAHLRRLARAAFAGRAVESLRAMITRVVDELLDRLEAAGRADFVATFAYPLASTVIANVIGVPPEDQQRFRGWSDDVATFIFGSGRPDRRELGVNGVVQLETYFRELLARARKEKDGFCVAIRFTKNPSSSEPLTSVSAFSGWPTPQAGSPKTEDYNEAGNTDSGRKTVALVSGHVAPSEAKKLRLGGWPSPRASDTGRTVWNPSPGGGNVQLDRMTSLWLAGWPTPIKQDASSAARRTTKTGIMHPGVTLTDAARMAGWPTASARAMPMRWRWPPENSCG
jgi:hypothetical protein